MDESTTRFEETPLEEASPPAGRRRRGRGFTLIELLVTVMIIGLLAAIAVPVYLGVQNSARDSAAKSDLVNAAIAIVAYQTKNGSYPSAISAAVLRDFGYSGSTVTDASKTAGTMAAFCLTATGSGGTSWYVTQASSPTTTKPSECA